MAGDFVAVPRDVWERVRNALMAGARGLHGKSPTQVGGLGVDFGIGCRHVLDAVDERSVAIAPGDPALGLELVQELRKMAVAAGEAGLDRVRLNLLLSYAINRIAQSGPESIVEAGK